MTKEKAEEHLKCGKCFEAVETENKTSCGCREWVCAPKEHLQQDCSKCGPCQECQTVGSRWRVAFLLRRLRRRHVVVDHTRVTQRAHDARSQGLAPGEGGSAPSATGENKENTIFEIEMSPPVCVHHVGLNWSIFKNKKSFDNFEKFSNQLGNPHCSNSYRLELTKDWNQSVIFRDDGGNHCRCIFLFNYQCVKQFFVHFNLMVCHNRTPFLFWMYIG